MKLKIKKQRTPDGSQAVRPPDVGGGKFSTAKRWSKFLAEGGHTPIVNYFLEHYHDLKPYPLTHGEAMFVIHLIYHKWGDEPPYPGYKSLAAKMGVSDKTARRLAKSLEEKKYLRREMRENQPNIFHLNKLIQALEDHKRANPRKHNSHYESQRP